MNTRKQKEKLDKFRQSFLLSTNDGTYPIERHQKLYQACKQAGIDWHEARNYVRSDAQKFFNEYISTLSNGRELTDQDIKELQHLHRRLGLNKPYSEKPLQSPSVSVSQQPPARIPLRTRFFAFLGMSATGCLFSLVLAIILVAASIYIAYLLGWQIQLIPRK